MKKTILTFFIFVALLFCIPVTTFAALTTNVQGSWKMDESSGNAADSSGNSNTLTNTNTATFVAGHILNAGHLVLASNQNFQIANASQTGLNIFNSDMTVAFWVQFSTLPSASSQWAFMGRSDGSKGWHFSVFNNAGQIRLQTNILDGTNNTNVHVDWSPSASTYYFVTMVFKDSPDTIDFYINGVQQGTTQTLSPTTHIASVATSYILGDAIATGVIPFNGDFDDVTIWSRALSGTEITQLYNAGVGLQYPFTLAATTPFYWTFDF